MMNKLIFTNHILNDIDISITFISRARGAIISSRLVDKKVYE
ncbi:hypothetical protein VAA_02983 [Vibrio anguillarum 775]|nr:hypothetical protein VAA_02983 [Vibrio anguillarum 775]